MRTWLRRYGPAEVVATCGALVAAAVGARLVGTGGAALAGTLGETVAFYGFVVARELRAERAAGGGRSAPLVLSDLLAEFGPAEVLDTCAVRPLAMYVGPLLTGSLTAGILAGKLAADLLFYALAAVGYELRRPAPTSGDPLAPIALDARRLELAEVVDGEPVRQVEVADEELVQAQRHDRLDSRPEEEVDRREEGDEGGVTTLPSSGWRISRLDDSAVAAVGRGGCPGGSRRPGPPAGQ